MKTEKKEEKVIGTNCYNCRFISNKEEPVDPKELNDEGGKRPWKKN